MSTEAVSNTSAAATASRLVVDVTPAPHATIVRPVTAWLDLSVAADFRAALVDLVKAGHRNLVIDLGGVSFVDSSGLSALVSALKMLKVGRDRRRRPREGRSRRPVARGDVRLAALQPPVASLLEIIRMNRVFPSYLTVEEAVKSFG
ncbi:MAG TPA: STAS domain-containing protein [Vicinamibacteria bacterium]|nr:STAS domain-containing protein [Vicinamibacteria bacterium]